MKNKYVYKLLLSHVTVLLVMTVILLFTFHAWLPKLMYSIKTQELIQTGRYLLAQPGMLASLPSGSPMMGNSDSLRVRMLKKQTSPPSGMMNALLTEKDWTQLNKGETLTFQHEMMHFPTPMTVVVLPYQTDQALLVGAPMKETETSIAQIDTFLWKTLMGTLVFAVVLSVFLSKGLQKRIQMMRNLAYQMAQGHFNKRIPIQGRDEIADLAADLNEMAKQLETLQKQNETYDRMRSQFLADISHELKTPLTSMRGLLEALRNDMVAEEEKGRVYFLLEKETLRLIRLVQGVMNLERIRSGEITLHRKTFALRPFLDDIMDSLRVLAEEKQLSFSVEAANSLMVKADDDRLRQMIINLVKNGIQFTEQGSICIKAYEDEEWTYIAVTDTGMGIPEKEQSEIFERFYKVDPSRSRDYGEMGLGLPLVRQLALAHKGDVTVQSEVGKGSTFTLQLPRE